MKRLRLNEGLRGLGKKPTLPPSSSRKRRISSLLQKHEFRRQQQQCNWFKDQQYQCSFQSRRCYGTSGEDKNNKTRTGQDVHAKKMKPSSFSSWGSLFNNLNPFAASKPTTVTGKLGNLEDEFEIMNEIGTGRYGIVRKVRKKKEKPKDDDEKQGKSENGTETEMMDRKKNLEQDDYFACKTMPKFTTNDDEETQLEEFKNELEILSQLDHPHIMGMEQVIEERENLHIISKLCTGGELFDRIIESGSFSEHDAAVIIRQVLLALEYLHDVKRIAHRDIKPENLLFYNKSPESPLCLCDFGMAQAFRKDSFMHSSCGSPSYVAPEVLDRNYTEKADLWSAGVILYIMLCGKVPFAGSTDDEIMRNVSLAKYNFSDPAWDDVSQSAIDLVKGLMDLNQASRLSASQALQHPWVDQMGQGRNAPLHVAFLNMKNFHSHNKLKKLSLEVIAKHLANSSKEEQDKYMIKLREIFYSIDHERTGKISADELARTILQSSKAINSFNVLQSAEELASMLQQSDTNRDGKIDLGEFLAAALSESIYLKESNLELAFRHFDRNNDGFLTLDEIREIQQDFQEEEFDRIDLNHDGMISYEEFAKALHGTKKN